MNLKDPINKSDDSDTEDRMSRMEEKLDQLLFFSKTLAEGFDKLTTNVEEQTETLNSLVSSTDTGSKVLGTVSKSYKKLGPPEDDEED